MLKPTTLIVCSDLDDLQKRRQILIDKYEKQKNFVKWSDTAVELDHKLFILKIVSMPPIVLDAIRGYTTVVPNHLLPQIENFVKEVNEICGITTSQDAETPPEATGAPENERKVEEGSNTQEAPKNKNNQE